MEIVKNTMNEPTDITCQFCHSELKYKYTDICRREKFNFLGQALGYDRYLICPVCKNEISLNPVVKLG